MKVGEICRSGVVYIGADEDLVRAATKMRTFHVGDLVVVDADQPHPMPIGIITDRDIVVGLVARGVNRLDQLTVGDVLSGGELVTAREDDDVETAMDRMRAAAVRRLPIVDANGTLVGIFTMDDGLECLVGQLSELVSIPHRQQRAEHAARP
jgi:CBS domain-containing protein